MMHISPVTTSISISPKEQADIPLPDEILIKIFFHLAPWDVKYASLVSKQWQSISNDQNLWELFKAKTFPELYNLNFLEIHASNSLEENPVTEKEKLPPDEFNALKKRILQHCKKKLHDDCFLEVLRVKHMQFQESPLQVFYSYAKTHREKVILYPGYLMAMIDYKRHSCPMEIYDLDVFNLFIDLGEEELIFEFFQKMNCFSSVPNDQHIVAEDLCKLDGNDKIISYPVLGVFKRLLDKDSYALIAGKLYKCNLAFEVKLSIISMLILKMKGLPWFQRSLIFSTLKANLKMD